MHPRELVRELKSKDLKDYVNIRHDDMQIEMDKRFQMVERLMNERSNTLLARFSGIEKATDLAMSNTNTKFDNVNNWRQAYGDQQSRLLTRSEVGAMLEAASIARDALGERISEMERSTVNRLEHDSLIGRIGALETALASLQGRLVALGVIDAVVTFGAVILAHYLH